MKKIIPLLFTIFSSVSLFSCNKEMKENKSTLTIGSMVDKDLTEIDSYNSLQSKIDNDEETFLIALHYGSSPSCGCWMTFKNQIKKYIVNYHVRVYSIDSFKIPDENGYGFIPLKADEPALYLVNKGKIVKKYQYGSKALETFFTDMEAIKKELEKYINYPNYYYVNEEFLNTNLKENPVNKAAVYFMRNGCGDCKYAWPHFMKEYGEDKTFDVKVWVFDLQEYYDLNDDKVTYSSIKEKYELSESANQNYGYLQGVVPTTQYYENGLLKDATVYFNDELEKQDDHYVIKDSYYSEERLSKLNYISSLDTKVLKGMEIPSEDVIAYEEYHYYAWNQSAASKYHDKFIEAFYKTYIL